MSEPFLLTKAQMARISPCFPLFHGVPCVDDRLVVSGIIYVIGNGLQWKDAPMRTDHTRPSTIASSAGPPWACSTGSFKTSPHRARSQIGS
jgi:transposase